MFRFVEFVIFVKKNHRLNERGHQNKFLRSTDFRERIFVVFGCVIFSLSFVSPPFMKRLAKVVFKPDAKLSPGTLVSRILFYVRVLKSFRFRKLSFRKFPGLHAHKQVLNHRLWLFPDPFATRFVPTFNSCLDFVLALSLSCRNFFMRSCAFVKLCSCSLVSGMRACFTFLNN